MCACEPGSTCPRCQHDDRQRKAIEDCDVDVLIALERWQDAGLSEPLEAGEDG